MRKVTKTGLNDNKAGGSASKWSVPSPDSIKPITAPAKPQTSSNAGGAATKTATTGMDLHGIPASIKSRY